jgi:hypothetical protein
VIELAIMGFLLWKFPCATMLFFVAVYAILRGSYN